ncbi:trypsin-like serine protease [Niveibacterium sp. 24ML]|uniref:trypsin-like serine protease n=1 Tax=Niveibacterium sp. 24ML TaxID=2985512 RepID=UPI00226F3E5D|nr:trypsin-like serine protease [Niveibacterium sp. 24ML]MCX9155692.1 trypsin-like serine protease [Niveibacterium sp. 24ML]
MIARSLCAALLLGFALPAAAILGGVPDGDAPDSPARRVDPDGCASPWAGAVSVLIGNGVFSGVVIADRWVLTAGHVAAGQRHSPAAVRVRVPCGPLLASVAEVVPHPAFAGYKSDRINFDDLSLLRLSEPLPPDVPRYPLFERAPMRGMLLTLVGYGAGGNPREGSTVPAKADTKRVGENALDQLVQRADKVAAAYLWDFDSSDPAASLLGGPGLGNQREATVAGGDSGSPAFVKDGAGWALLGINTFQIQLPAKPPKISMPPPKFGSGGGGMLVAPYAAWIRSVIEAAPSP